MPVGPSARGPDAQCPMPHAQCPMPNARCPMPNAQCPMPHARCQIVPHVTEKGYNPNSTELLGQIPHLFPVRKYTPSPHRVFRQQFDS